MRCNLLRWAERRFPNAAGDVSSSSASALLVGVVASSSAPDVSLTASGCVSCGQPEVLNHLFFCAGLSHLKVKLLEECTVALARPGWGGSFPES